MENILPADEHAFPRSRYESGGSTFWIGFANKEKRLFVTLNSTKDSVYNRLDGKESLFGGEKVKICPLSHENAVIIREAFPFTAPVSHKGRAVSMGLGDRLGLASPGHIDLIRNYDVFPVLAQQSIRELNLTGRTFGDVLDSATWAVFQEGYMSGFGADGDHVKTAAEVNMALDSGFTMITLDCSEHIRSDIPSLDEDAVSGLYDGLPAEDRERWEAEYINKTIRLADGTEIFFSKASLERDALIYGGAIEHAERVYRECIVTCGRNVDFELSVDETPTETLPESHYFVANELYRRGIVLTCLAPRFAGEFQKGIDFKGDTGAFEKGFVAHVNIARHFGYKISVHSGSDKFSVFPLVGKHSKGKFHLKTAGTNWLEALRVIAVKDAPFFRRLLTFSLQNLPEAKRYYHTTENTGNIPPADSLTDAELPGLLDQPDARQVLHICYGLILLKGHEPEDKEYFRERIYKCLRENERAYRETLRAHIGLHLSKLGLVPVKGGEVCR